MKICIASSDKSFRDRAYESLKSFIQHQVSVLSDCFEGVHILTYGKIDCDVAIVDVRNAWPAGEYNLKDLLNRKVPGKTLFIFITHYTTYPEIEVSDRVVFHFCRAEPWNMQHVIEKVLEAEHALLV